MADVDGPGMRIPSVLPALLLVLGMGLVAFDVFHVVGASQEHDRPTVTHRDANLTFVAMPLAVEPGDELRTPGWKSREATEPTVVRVVLRNSTSNQTEEIPFNRTDGGVRITLTNTWWDHGSWSENQTNATALRLYPTLSHRLVDWRPLLVEPAPTVLVVPAGCARRLQTGDEFPVLYEGTAGPAITVRLPERIEACDAARTGVEMVWLVRNETADYANRSALLLDAGIEGRDEARFASIEGGALELDPWLRWGGGLLMLAAAVLTVRHRAGDALDHGDGPMGGTLALVEAGRRFLRSLRNAWAIVMLLVVALAMPLALQLAMFASGLSSGADVTARAQPFVGWDTFILVLALLGVVVAALVAGQPALAAHRTLKRWSARESSPPVEGEL